MQYGPSSLAAKEARVVLSLGTQQVHSKVILLYDCCCGNVCPAHMSIKGGCTCHSEPEVAVVGAVRNMSTHVSIHITAVLFSEPSGMMDLIVES